MQAGAKGVKIQIAGRLGGGDMSRRIKQILGSIPLHTLDADVDYGFAPSFTTYGTIGVKVWIYRGMYGESVSPDEARQAPSGRPAQRGGRGRPAGGGGRGRGRQAAGGPRRPARPAGAKKAPAQPPAATQPDGGEGKPAEPAQQAEVQTPDPGAEKPE